MIYTKAITDGTWHDAADVYLGLLMVKRDVLLKRIIAGARHVHTDGDGLKVAMFAVLEKLEPSHGTVWVHYSDTSLSDHVSYRPRESTRTEVKAFMKENPLLAPLYLKWAKERFK